MELNAYRATGKEKARLDNLLELVVPRRRDSILEIGSRDGFHTRILTKYFRTVTALDLVKPSFDGEEGIVPVQGNVTALDFPDNTFDCVLCAEVLEHVPQLEQAQSSRSVWASSRRSASRTSRVRRGSYTDSCSAM